jgi:hypothetical protein
MVLRRLSNAALVLLLLALASGARAQAVPADLTGTWEGKVSCKLNHADDGATGSYKIDSDLLIVSVDEGANGTDLNVVLDGSAFSGRTVDTGTEKGEVVFVRCGSGDSAWAQPAEIWKSGFKVKLEKGTGSITGTSVYNDANGAPGQGTLVTCKGKWKRISPDDLSGMPSCEDP